MPVSHLRPKAGNLRPLRISDSGFRACCAGLIAICFCQAAGAQPASSASPPQEVELSAGLGAPAKVVVLPLLLHLNEPREFVRLEVEVELPLDVVELKAVRPGKENEETGTVSHRTRSPQQESPLIIEIEKDEGLAGGELARIVLTIREKAAEQAYPLSLEARAWPAGSEQQPVPLATLDGILVVSRSAPVFGCFFYMH